MRTIATSKDDNVRFDATLAFERPQARSSMFTSAWRGLTARTSQFWSATDFSNDDVQRYARSLMLEETRRGVILMAGLSFSIQLAALLLYLRLGLDGSFLYTYSLLALLSFHTIFSTRFVNDMRPLYMLGAVLLVITGVAIMAVAHQTGGLNAGLMASVVLIFMVIPLVPWGLRETLFVVVLTYLVFTLSAVSVDGRFPPETLWTLQFLVIASATIATLTVMRNTRLRRADIEARYNLERARGALELLSTRDPLTQAWNRRYLQNNFVAIAREARENELVLYLAVLDVDAFKPLNDTFGHHHGDDVLKRLVRILVDNLPGTAHVIRLGGDEFAVLDSSPNFPDALERCLHHLRTDPKLLAVSDSPVGVSVGFASVGPGETADLDALYRAADGRLYETKLRRGGRDAKTET